eukprot:7513732-Pyramimonas_sp.AAC.1
MLVHMSVVVYTGKVCVCVCVCRVHRRCGAHGCCSVHRHCGVHRHCCVDRRCGVHEQLWCTKASWRTLDRRCGVHRHGQPGDTLGQKSH